MVSCVLVCLAFALVSTVLVESAVAEVSIGLYSDNYGSSCSFSGNNVGLVTAHVVVRTNGTSIRGVRFAAPIPPCFDAVFVGETTPAGVIAVGDSRTGVSLTVPGCNTGSMHLLDITYYAGSGTSPCCEFRPSADPLVGYLEATDCAFTSIPMQSSPSYMNADSSCACATYQDPPSVPSNPYPADASSGVNPALALQWACANPESMDIFCDVYFGTTPNPPLLAASIPGVTSWGYPLPRLAPDTMYFWRAVSRTVGSANVPGPLWTFRTAINNAPVVHLADPLNLRTEVSVTPTLTWTATDESSLKYDVYLGTDPANLPKVANGLSVAQYSPSALAFLTTYYWRVTAHDLDGADGVSETWSFSTVVENAPNRPTLHQPASGSTNQSVSNLILSWSCTDPQGQALKYDVYLGTAADPPLVSHNQTQTYYNCSHLEVLTTYYWRIVAIDTDGLTRSGATWNFTTHANSLPYAPSNPDPHNGSTHQPLNTFLTWDGRDPDGQSLTYDI